MRGVIGAVVGATFVAVTAWAGEAKDAGTAGEPVKLFSGFKFTEGPAPAADGSVYFTDIPNNRIHKVDAKGELSTFLEDSKGCNGLMVDGVRLLAAQRDEGRVISIDLETKKISVVAEKFEGNRFIGPNDLVVDRDGGVYFTDPRFPSSAPGHQEKQGVYYAPIDGAVVRLADDLPRPNGILLSPDEKTLYVFPAGTPDMMAYPVLAPGKIGPGRVFCKLDQVEGKTPRGGDGAAMAKDGTLYITQPDLEGIQVFTPSGKAVGLIKLPGRPTNVKFGGKDLKTLYVTVHFRDAANTTTTDAALYAIKMKRKGHRYGGR
jgi:gluconolactonase